ncbi:excalibur calcium-binding domain-containing protein [Pseudaquidulcibacter saccharophilus]|uniref:excalibur calcium-binding domain-containing protein n=1 Tax=Pseudaquidulcibacter saccharophilus TaxID=2831900 RepID=UPI001EFF2623|nr:excalibur calcium-binding domain-containing protein [Pseudaquidulcibacter saccharophilus]
MEKEFRNKFAPRYKRARRLGLLEIFGIAAFAFLALSQLPNLLGYKISLTKTNEIQPQTFVASSNIDESDVDARDAEARAINKKIAELKSNPIRNDEPVDEPTMGHLVSQNRNKAGYYRNCAAAYADHAAPIYSNEAAYRLEMDGDGDGIACEAIY